MRTPHRTPAHAVPGNCGQVRYIVLPSRAASQQMKCEIHSPHVKLTSVRILGDYVARKRDAGIPH